LVLSSSLLEYNLPRHWQLLKVRLCYSTLLRFLFCLFKKRLANVLPKIRCWALGLPGLPKPIDKAFYEKICTCTLYNRHFVKCILFEERNCSEERHFLFLQLSPPLKIFPCSSFISGQGDSGGFEPKNSQTEERKLYTLGH
jgi:hypothetical protein